MEYQVRPKGRKGIETYTMKVISAVSILSYFKAQGLPEIRMSNNKSTKTRISSEKFLEGVVKVLYEKAACPGW